MMKYTDPQLSVPQTHPTLPHAAGCFLGCPEKLEFGIKSNKEIMSLQCQHPGLLVADGGWRVLEASWMEGGA